MQNRVFIKGFDAICAVGDGMDEIFENMLDKRCKIPQDPKLTVNEQMLYAWRIADIDAKLASCIDRALKEVPKDQTALFFVGKEPQGNFKSKTKMQTSSDALSAAIEEIKNSKSEYALISATFEYDATTILDLYSKGMYSNAVAKPFDIDLDGMNCSDNVSAVLLSKDGIFEIISFQKANTVQDAIVRVLELSGTDAKDIDYIEACANGVVSDDKNEAQMLSEIFSQEPYVGSSKGFCGHSFESSMLLSICMGTIALEENIVFASSFLEHGFTNELNFSYANRVKILEKILVNAHETEGEYSSVAIGKICEEQ